MQTDTNSAEELRKKVICRHFLETLLHLFLQLNPTEAPSYKAALDAIKNPVNACQQLYEKIEILIEKISKLEAAGKEGKSLTVVDG